MITEYRLTPQGRLQSGPASLESYGPEVVWLDALRPDDDELFALSKLMGFEVPNRHDMTEIELSNRLYKEDGSFVMIANLLPKSDRERLPPRPAAFVLRENLLLTIRFSDFYSFEHMARTIARHSDKYRPITVFCDLLDEAVSDRADDLEFSMRHLEDLTSSLFHSSIDGTKNTTLDNQELDAILKRIGLMGEKVASVRESIASLQRVVNYARTYLPDSWLGEQAFFMDSMKNDLTALADEAGFFMNKLSFNLDATLGLINIEETKVIRLLSIVTLLLAPPTLIAGIYGMNFEIMPELAWPFGYIFSLGLMATTAVVSIWYLKRKKWM